MATISNNEKKLRREVELLRAQLKMQMTKPMIDAVSTKPVAVGVKARPSDDFSTKRQILPLKEIRADLVKTVMYVVFVVGVLTVLKIYPITTILALLPRQ